MRKLLMSGLAILVLVGSVAAMSTANAQSEPTKQKSQDGSSPTTVGPGSASSKQKTQAELPQVGPASGAYKQKTQAELPQVGPASGAYKQQQ